MAILSRKLIWVEGTLLSQQHFQYWQQYNEEKFRFCLRLQRNPLWGIEQLVIDQDGLINGMFRIKRCVAIFKNGEIIHFDESEEGTLNYKIDAESAKQTLAIYLALPLGNQVEGLSNYPKPFGPATYLADFQQQSDCYDPRRQKQIILARPQLCLMSELEVDSQYETLKVAVLYRLTNGQFEINKDYIPPVLKLQAHERLRGYIQNSMDRISAYIRIIRERQKKIQLNPLDREKNEFRYIDLLQILWGAEQRLKCYLSAMNGHPYECYLAIIDLISGLQSFVESDDIENIVAYDHDDLTKCFERIYQVLNVLLQKAVPTYAHWLKLNKISKTTYQITNIEKEYLEKAQLFLAVHHLSDSNEWIAQFIRVTKVAPISLLESVITTALPGIKLIHQYKLPTRLTAKAGYEYFYLEPTGQIWQQMQAEKNLSIFIPQAFEQSQIELITLMDETI